MRPKKAGKNACPTLKNQSLNVSGKSMFHLFHGKLQTVTATHYLFEWNAALFDGAFR